MDTQPDTHVVPEHLPGVKSDRWIRDMAIRHGMIEPFVDHQVRDGVISYGLSSYGYDLRLADEFRLLQFGEVGEVDEVDEVGGKGGKSGKSGESGRGGKSGKTLNDPKAFDPDSLIDYRGEICVIPPHSFVLGRSLEYFRIPRGVITICFGKSTYARCGIVTNITPFEPEWEGFATLAVANTTPLPARIYAGEGIAQLLFLGGDGPCAQSYADKKGKYQAQQRVTPARL